jgi:hypothetical protein
MTSMLRWLSISRRRLERTWFKLPWRSRLPCRPRRILAQRSSDRPRGRPRQAHHRRPVRHSRLPVGQNVKSLIFSSLSLGSSPGRFFFGVWPMPDNARKTGAAVGPILIHSTDGRKRRPEGASLPLGRPGLALHQHAPQERFPFQARREFRHRICVAPPPAGIGPLVRPRRA